MEGIYNEHPGHYAWNVWELLAWFLQVQRKGCIKAVVLNWGPFWRPPPRDIWPCLETFFVVTSERVSQASSGERCCYTPYTGWLSATKPHLAPNAQSAEGEKPHVKGSSPEDKDGPFLHGAEVSCSLPWTDCPLRPILFTVSQHLLLPPHNAVQLPRWSFIFLIFI